MKEDMITEYRWIYALNKNCYISESYAAGKEYLPCALKQQL